MAVRQMTKVRILFPREALEEFLQTLQSTGLIQVNELSGRSFEISKESEKALLSACPWTLQEVESLIQRLKTFRRGKVNLRQKFLGDIAEMTKEEFSHYIEYFDYSHTIGQLRPLLEEHDANAELVHSLSLEARRLSVWESLPVTIERSLETESTRWHTLKIPIQKLASFQAQLSDDTVLQIVSQNEHTAQLFLWHLKDDDRTDKLCEDFSGEYVDLFQPSYEGQRIVEILHGIRLKRREARVRLEIVRDELAEMTSALSALKALYDHLLAADIREETTHHVGNTRRFRFVEGWTQERHLERLRAIASELSPFSHVEIIQPESGEEPPVYIVNPVFFKPFEMITSMYGLPGKSEMDPTVHLGPFFILFYGLCLTDAGYGLVLTALALALILFARIPLSRGGLPWLLLYAGIVTFFIGIPFGGWFGVPPERAPDFLLANAGAPISELRYIGQVWNLGEKSGIDFLTILAIAVGIAQIAYGTFLSGYWKVVHGKTVQAIYQDFSLHVLILGVGIFLLPEPIAAIPSMVRDIALWVSVGFFIWSRGYGSPWYLRPFAGAFLSLVFFMSGISNVLSYLRLLALGLATGALAFAINEMAWVLSGFFPGILGMLVFVVILLGWHLLSIVLNALSAFVHSGRLQFIEFFSNFYEGGGAAFEPFARKRKYTLLV